MINRLVDCIDPSLLAHSGKVFYSGRRAFSQRTDLYLIGINPGGDPIAQSSETIRSHTDEVLHRNPARWSAYSDESWGGKPSGTRGMQPRVLHMLKRLGRDPRETPASNLVFVRSSREAKLGVDKNTLVDLCWPFHQKVIELLRPRVLVCFGKTTGRSIRTRLAAHLFLDSFVEQNKRGWTSDAHANVTGTVVVTVTHPSIADWKNPKTDPTPLVQEILNQT